ncbi:hypothetical protein RI367_000666 [Sorochytrium milnesiophthora]
MPSPHTEPQYNSFSEREYLSTAESTGTAAARDLADEDPDDWFGDSLKGVNKVRKEWLRSQPEGLGYTFGIGGILMLELIGYTLVRQWVNIYERYFIWIGRNRRFREKLRQSETYEQWAEAAQRLDVHLKKTSWQETPASGYYDYKLIANLTRRLKKARLAGDTTKLRDLCTESACKSNIGGIENIWLYSHTYFGTKRLIEDYLQEVKDSLLYLANHNALSIADKRQFFKRASQQYGRSALCLSGGATFGYYHLGVVKALMDKGLLPKVITGTSAGSLIASLVCTRTDDELREMLIPDLYKNLTACDEPWVFRIIRLMQSGVMFSSERWQEKTRWVTHGDLTFMEAYRRTGRILNITVVSSDRHSPPKLLNYVTSPNVVVWSAVLASSAVPGVLEPVTLMMKTKVATAGGGAPQEKIVPFLGWGKTWRDGSLRTDIPVKSLHQLFNVNYTIVSQVNPHITLFFFEHRGGGGHPTAHRGGRGWRGGFIASALEHFLKLDLKKWLKIVRDLRLMPTFMDQDWSFLWLQKFDGNVTILPKSTISDYIHILTDPDEYRMTLYLIKGQRNTWPKMKIIANRMGVEQIVEEWRRTFNRDRKTQVLASINGRRSLSSASLPRYEVLNTASDVDTDTNGAVRPDVDDEGVDDDDDRNIASPDVGSSLEQVVGDSAAETGDNNHHRRQHTVSSDDDDDDDEDDA